MKRIEAAAPLQPQDETYDAIIIGAGPAGATAAIRLAAAGWSVAIVEKRAFPRRKVCGECVAATNLPLLDAMGVGEAFREMAGPPLNRVGLFVGSHALVAPLPPLPAEHTRWGRALGREHLDTLLLDRAREVGATVWQPWTVREHCKVEGLHCCTLGRPGTADQHRLKAAVLIRAHGSWEPEPRNETEPARPPPIMRRRARPLEGDLLAFKGSYRGAAIEPGLLPVLTFPGGYGGMVLGDHGVTTLAFCIRRRALAALREQSSADQAALAALEHVARSCAGVRRALAGAQQVGRWLAVGPLQTGIRQPWRPDQSFAIGNAAGEAHPILGEGISMAMQSAWLLCDALIAERQRPDCAPKIAADWAAVGTDYADRWRAQFAQRIRFAAVCAHLAMRPGSAGPLLALLQRWPTLLTHGARMAGKVRPLAIAAPAAIPHTNGVYG